MNEEFNPTLPEEDFYKFKCECAQAVADFHIHFAEVAAQHTFTPGETTEMEIDAKIYAIFIYYNQLSEDLTDDQVAEIEDEIEERMQLHTALTEMGFFSDGSDLTAN